MRKIIFKATDMEKILGIDTGTNSLGWTLAQRNDDNQYTLLDHGVVIFQEGVKVENGKESSKAAERTKFRSQRKHYWRRKVRKTRLLTILVQEGLCPDVPKDAIRLWRTKGVYPNLDALMDWERTSDNAGINPYAFRHRCLHEELDLNTMADRYVLGRAIYHINQRRGFLSNRKDASDDGDEQGTVKKCISQLSEDMASAGCEYLGDYFYQLYQKGERIRSKYTARNEHYLKEFSAICAKQHLSADLTERIEKAIFFQRPLKSQKGQVSKCTFEPRKKCCPISHPLFEEFRMYHFLNNIKIKTPSDFELRPLSADEKEKVKPLFFNVKKKQFDFEEIAKVFAGKGKYGFHKTDATKLYTFNYAMDTKVSGCPVTAGLRDIFGEDWIGGVMEVYLLGDNKTKSQVVDDIWHALFSFADEENLKQFAISRLQLDEKNAAKFAKISIPQGYSSISLKAIRNILPYMKDWGLIYSEAVFLGKFCDVVPYDEWSLKPVREAAIERCIEAMHDDSPENLGYSVEQRLKNYLRSRYNASEQTLKALYHPSMLESYPRQMRNAEGIFQLGSPRISSVRNPMAMRSLFQLRHVVNTLLKEKKIDEDTTIHIEFARELNDANRRIAIKRWQQDNEKDRADIAKRIKELYAQQGMSCEPSDTDILKYQLWEEQGHVCLYTGKTIGVTDFLGPNPKFDIEHTVPRSRGGDSTKMNLTLCESRFNREEKRAQMPSQLSNHEEILLRIQEWKEKVENLNKLVRKLKGSSASTKESKDAILQKKHKLLLELAYWRGKCSRFEMMEVPEGFSRRQGVDISVISRYARLYLKSVFRRVFTVRGIATSDFRKAWGLQDIYTKKERVNHVHHCIDSVVIACIGPYEYAELAKFYKAKDLSDLGEAARPQFPKPWPTFTEDIKKLHEDLLVVHKTQNPMGKNTRKRDENGLLLQGDTARGSLHQDTYYGAIEVNGEVKYVIRKPADSLANKDIENVVDAEVAKILQEAVGKHGTLKKAVEADDLWMNKEKGIKIKKVRLFAPTVTQPLNIREQRDQSPKEYKRTFHVANDSNYMMAVYEGTDKKGKLVRKHKIVNNLDAASWFRASSEERKAGLSLVPGVSKEGYPFAFSLQIGTIVLLYNESPDELWGADKSVFSRRMYKVTILDKDGRITMLHCQEARPTSELGKGESQYNPNLETAQPKLKVSISKLRALISGVDFTINDVGEITRLR